MKPLSSYVVVRPLKTEDAKKGGIIRLHSPREATAKGEVMSVGPGRLCAGGHVLSEVKVNDHVLYQKDRATEILIDDVEHLIMRESSIMAIL